MYVIIVIFIIIISIFVINELNDFIHLYTNIYNNKHIYVI